VDELERKRLLAAALQEKALRAKSPPVPFDQSAADKARIAEAPFASRVVSAASGLPFIGNWMDELRGAVRGEDEAEAFRQTKGAMERENPTEDMLLGLGGGVAGSIPMAAAALPSLAGLGGASLLGRTAAGIGLGAAAGGTEGAIYGAGDEADRAGGALAGGAAGAGMGGLIGGVMPGASDGIGAIVKALTGGPSKAAARSVGLSPTSTEAVLRALQGDDALSGAGRQRIAQAGPGAMLADAGQSAQDLLDTAIQRSGKGANVAREAVEGRATAAGQQVRGALDNLVPGGQVAVKGTPMRELYDAAYSSPIDYASDAGRRLEGLLPRVPQAVVDRANRLIQMDTDAINPKQIILGADGRISELPNVLQLDYITRALNDVARAGDGMGALGGSTNEGRIYGKLARQIRGAVRETVPAYGQALDTAATEIGARQAQEFGQTVMRPGVTRDMLREEIEGMGAAEVGHLKIGLRQGVEETLDNVRRSVTDPNVDARQATQAIKDFSSDAAREKLRIVFGDQADGFISQLDEAARALELRAGVATNSRTFGRQEVDRTVKESLHGGPVETLARGEPLGATKNVVQALTGRTAAGNAAREQDVYAEIARLLTESRGTAAVDTMRVLEQLMANGPMAQATAGRIGNAGAAGLGVPAYLLGQQTLGGR
jgi:hypothetical protein